MDGNEILLLGLGIQSPWKLVDLGEDAFSSTGMYGSYQTLFGDWLSFAQVPNGYFYDDDGDPDTDNVLLAHFDEASGKWIQNRDLTAGVVTASFDGNNGTQYDSEALLEAALLGSNPGLLTCNVAPPNTACLAGIDAIEDLAKFNLTYFLDALDVSASVPELYTAYANAPTFTLRVTAKPSAVPVVGVLPLLGLGLLSLLGGVRRRHKA